MSAFETSQALSRAHEALGAGNYFDAERLARQALQLGGRDAEALFILSRCAMERGRFDEAEAWAKKGARKEPRDARFLCLAAMSLTARSRLNEALACYEKSAKLDPSLVRAASGRAEVLLLQRKPEKALAVVTKELQRGNASGELVIAQVRALQALDRHEDALEAAQRLTSGAGLHAVHRGELHLAMARSLDKLGRTHEAFEAYARGNSLVAPPFDLRADEDMHAQIRSVFSRDAMARYQRSSIGSELPVFIVGMPRSGSTLVEQILHAHPQAYGAGELSDLRAVLQRVPELTGAEDMYPACVPWLNSQQMTALGEAYIAALRAHSRTAVRIVDKNLNNYEMLGMIALMLPKARIIHATRHPLDCCVSCFTQRFMGAMHAYSYDLANLGRHYRLYHDLMAHWANTLDVQIFEVRYEDVVADVASHARTIVEFCGLEWDERCLRFHEAKREVITMSYDQVRRPIYDSSVGRWARFEQQLGPLIEALGPLAIAR